MKQDGEVLRGKRKGGVSTTRRSPSSVEPRDSPHRTYQRLGSLLPAKQWDDRLEEAVGSIDRDERADVLVPRPTLGLTTTCCASLMIVRFDPPSIGVAPPWARRAETASIRSCLIGEHRVEADELVLG